MRQWSTSDVSDIRRRPYWMASVCDAFLQLECAVPKNAMPFFGTIARCELATLGLTRIKSTQQMVFRTPLQVRRASEELFFVNIQIAGTSELRQDGKVAVLCPGDLALYDSTRPYRLSFCSDFEQCVISLPRALLHCRLPQAQLMIATKMSSAGSGPARILSCMIAEFLSGSLSCSQIVDATADGIIAMLAATLAEYLTPLTHKSNTSATRRDRIKAYVLEQLRDPELCIGMIAERLGMATSTVHRAWEGESQSIASWMWTLRLNGAHRDLRSSTCSSMTITEIAYHWGFSSSAHFSRAFRDRFGMPPKDARADVRSTRTGKLSAAPNK